MDTKKLEEIKKVYELISNQNDRENLSLQTRVQLIRFLEKETGMDFKNTEDFFKKMDSFILENNESAGTVLKEVRQKKGLGQLTLAELFGVSQQYISQLESNCKPLNKKALQFIEENMYA